MEIEHSAATAASVSSGDGVGRRLADLRKLRGMTQHQLASAANFSESLVKKVEQGSVPPSAAFVAGAARALSVTPSHLYGTVERAAAEQPEAESAGIIELRRALDAFDDPHPDGGPLTLDFIDDRLTAVAGSIFRLRYGDAAYDLAALLHHLYVLVNEPEPDQARAYASLHDAYRLTATVAGRFRQGDLAAIASERHMQIAPLTGDPQRVAVSAFHRSTRLLQLGEYDAGLRVIDRARSNLDESPQGRGVAVQLGLRGGVLSARAGDRDGADEQVREARALAEQYSPPAEPFLGLDATAINILTHWIALPVEGGDGQATLARAEDLVLPDADRPERIGRLHVDLARAALLAGDRSATITHLNAAKAIDPHNTKRHPAVRETVLALADSDRRATDSLSSFASWAGIQL